MIEVVIAAVLTIILIASVVAFIIIVGVAALNVWNVKACDSCKHSYERIDTLNDKNMILVCRKCGKIKKLRK